MPPKTAREASNGAVIRYHLGTRAVPGVGAQTRRRRPKMDHKNPYRTHTAGALRKDDIGRSVRLAGWVHRRRDHGGLIFIDLRDRWGITQVTFHPEKSGIFSEAERLRP